MFVITKWTNQVRFCLGYLGLSCSVEIKYIQQFLHKLLMNFKNLEKCDILKNTEKIYCSQNFKCLVFFEVDKTSLLPTALKFDKNFTQNHFSSKKIIFLHF